MKIVLIVYFLKVIYNVINVILILHYQLVVNVLKIPIVKLILVKLLEYVRLVLIIMFLIKMANVFSVPIQILIHNYVINVVLIIKLIPIKIYVLFKTVQFTIKSVLLVTFLTKMILIVYFVLQGIQ